MSLPVAHVLVLDTGGEAALTAVLDRLRTEGRGRALVILQAQRTDWSPPPGTSAMRASDHPQGALGLSASLALRMLRHPYRAVILTEPGVRARLSGPLLCFTRGPVSVRGTDGELQRLPGARVRVLRRVAAHVLDIAVALALSSILLARAAVHRWARRS